jgi:hypothetical protein
MKIKIKQINGETNVRREVRKLMKIVRDVTKRAKR